MPGAGSLATAAMNLNIYDAMVSTRNLKLKIDIVETLFLDEFGDPAVWYRTDPKTRTVKASREGIDWGKAVELLQDAAAGRGATSGQPLCIERSRAVALLLQEEDLGALAQELSGRNVQASTLNETSPFALQPYTAPRDGLRFVVAYMRNEHGTACEAFPVPYKTRYLDVSNEREVARHVAPVKQVTDQILLELRHLTLSAVTFMRKAHKLSLDTLMVEFVQDDSGKLWFHTTIGVHVAGKDPSWTCNYDAESKLIKQLIERLYEKQPAMRVFQRSSTLPHGLSEKMPSPAERVRYRKQAQREIDELITQPVESGRPASRPSGVRPTPPASARGSSRASIAVVPQRPITASSAEHVPKEVKNLEQGGFLSDTEFGDVGSSGFQTALLEGMVAVPTPLGSAETGFAQGGRRPSSSSSAATDSRAHRVYTARASPLDRENCHTSPARLNTLASLRYYQVETLKDALQEQFSSATQAELSRVQEGNRRRQALEELEQMRAAYGELHRHHDNEMEAASSFISDLQEKLDLETAARQAAEAASVKAIADFNFAQQKLEEERSAHADKILAYGGRIQQLESENAHLNATLGQEVAELSATNADLRARLESHSAEQELLHSQLAEKQELISSLQRTVAEQLTLIQLIRAERAELLRAAPLDRSAWPKKATVQLSIQDLLCHDLNPVREMDMVQKALAGRKIVLQQLYKYYSWTSEKESAPRLAKMRMSCENFVKLCVDAKIVSPGKYNASWAENVFIAACLQRYAVKRQAQHAQDSSGGTEFQAVPVAERYLRLSEFMEAIVRLAYAQYMPSAKSQSDKAGTPCETGGTLDLAARLEACLDEKFVPFAKHQGSQITNWFMEVCKKESLAFETY